MNSIDTKVIQDKIIMLERELQELIQSERTMIDALARCKQLQEQKSGAIMALRELLGDPNA